MKLWLNLLLIVTLFATSASATDIGDSYGFQTFPGRRANVVVTLCPSADGSMTAVACASGGTTIPNPLPTILQPTASSSAGIVPVIGTTAANSLVLKATPGNLYSVYATNLTTTAGLLMVFNATSAPADGAVTPVECVPIPANNSTASATGVIRFGGLPAEWFGVGMVAVVSGGSNCFNKSTGTVTAFIKGMVQ